MGARLAELLAEARFTLYGIRRAHWDGEVFVGDFARVGPEKHLSQIGIVYERAIDEAVVVSSLDPRVEDVVPMSAHLTAFVSRFEPAYVLKRMKPRKGFNPFPDKDFTGSEVVIAIGGQNAGAQVWRHRQLPLDLVRAPLRVGERVTDLCLAGWRHGVRDLAALVEPVNVALAREIDG